MVDYGFPFAYYPVFQFSTSKLVIVYPNPFYNSFLYIFFLFSVLHHSHEEYIQEYMQATRMGFCIVATTKVGSTRPAQILQWLLTTSLGSRITGVYVGTCNMNAEVLLNNIILSIGLRKTLSAYLRKDSPKTVKQTKALSEVKKKDFDDVGVY